MSKISKLVFYRSGEVVRDIGLIYLDNIITEMSNEGYKIRSILHSNYLEIHEFNKNEFFKYIINQKVSKYFPYVRNSSKYGHNSQSEENFHSNFLKLLDIVEKLNLKDEKEQMEILRDYENLEATCTICHTYLITKYDITHKNELKIRKNSKYNYSFMGWENNTFNNYGLDNPSVCFVCEFLNLMYLLYMSLAKPSVLVVIEDLKVMKFLNYKLLLSIENLNEKGFYRKLAQYKNRKVRLYKLITHAKKGVILKLNSILEFENIIRNIKLSDLIDRFNFGKDSAEKKKLCKGFIISNNIESLKCFLIKDLLFIDNKDEKRILDEWKSKSNIKIYLEILTIISKEGENIKMNKFNNPMKENEFEKLGFTLGRKISQENKKTIMFKLNQMLKADNRTGIFQTLVHLITVNELSIPKNFSKVIINGSEYELHYNIGKLMESFLIENKEDE
ncbi:hypothetical protein [Tepidibacter thalassicus]|uniref:CRISPR-associated protein Cst1 n=1 Tax=Tepidibacter thalassicus DSM 15285 TaxID=1123350 RepID=A0A1M5PW78_9FIRM|nr:hypothetical protein [Tepidibacter thalassicus]SHH05503.1 hypothetical protein SAMN02744040_00611 [Tepidibacter thalassicus DSM 15285]